MTTEEMLNKYNEEDVDILFEHQAKTEKFEGFISVFENKKDTIMNKEKQYLELIKVQEQIIKDLKASNYMTLLLGGIAGFTLAHLILTLIK
jgi:dihydroorotase